MTNCKKIKENIKMENEKMDLGLNNKESLFVDSHAAIAAQNDEAGDISNTCHTEERSDVSIHNNKYHIFSFCAFSLLSIITLSFPVPTQAQGLQFVYIFKGIEIPEGAVKPPKCVKPNPAECVWEISGKFDSRGCPEIQYCVDKDHNKTICLEGRCVECITNADCLITEPICQNNVCVPCPNGMKYDKEKKECVCSEGCPQYATQNPTTCNCTCDTTKGFESIPVDGKCVCKDDYELCNGICVPICNDVGQSGKRDEKGNCICDETTCCCPEDYKKSTDGTCIRCPTETTDGAAEYCETICQFTPDDPVDCCQMVVFDGRYNCSEWGTDDSERRLVLGKMKGTYKITYISGAMTNYRYSNYITYGWFGTVYGHSPTVYQNLTPISEMPGTGTYYNTAEEAKAANQGKFLTIGPLNGVDEIFILRRDGITGYACDGTPIPGCSDNCGQIKYLFQKISD